MTQHYVARKIVTAWAEEKDGQAGYAVKYRDGYKSWCPKDKFEADNRPLGHAIGTYSYEQQLLMASVAEMEDRLLEILHDEGELADMERQVLALHSEILQKRIAVFANVEKVEVDVA